MSKFFKYSGLVILTLILVAVALPFIISIDKYQLILQDKVKEATGYELLIKDKLSFSLFPRPELILSGVTVSDLLANQQPPLLEIKKVAVVLSPFPLLAGRIVIADIILEKPTIYLEKQKEAGKRLIHSDSEKNPSSATSKSFEMPKLPFEVRRLTIKNGQVVWAQDKDKVILENINLSAKDLFGKGPMEFTISSRIFDEDFILEGSVNTNLALIPVSAILKIKEEKAVLRGDFDPVDASFKGNISLQGNTKHLATLLPVAWKTPQQDYNLTALIAANREMLTVKDLAFSMAQISAKGNASYNFKDSSPALNLNAEPGGIKVDVTRNPGQQLYKVSIQAKSFKPVLESLQLDTKTFPVSLGQPFSLTAMADHRQNAAELKNISLQVGKVSINGSLAGSWKPKLSLSYDSVVKLPLMAQELKIKGHTSSQNDIWQTDTHITLAGANTNVTGKIDVTKDCKLSLTITSSGQNFGTTLNQLLGQKGSAASLGSFSLVNTVSGQLPVLNLALNKFETSMHGNKISLNGKANIDLTAKPIITIDLIASEINLNDIASQKKPGSSKENAGGTKSAGLAWSQEKIDLSFLNTFDGAFTFSIPKLKRSPLNIDNLKINLHLASGRLDLKSFTGNVYGGLVEATGHLAAKDGEAQLKAGLKKAGLKEVVPDYREIKITEGNFDAALSLQSWGASEYQYVNNLAGDVSITGTNGRISGIDLQKVLDALNKVKNLESLMHLLDSSFSGGETVFNSLEGSMKFKEGIGHLTRLKLDANNVTATASGNIDLPKYYVDVISVINVNINNLPPFNVRLYGPLDNIQRKIDIKKLKSYLLKNILNDVIDKAGGSGPAKEILKGLLGGTKEKQKPADDPAPSQPPPPEETGSQSPQSQIQNEAEKLLRKGLGNIFSQ